MSIRSERGSAVAGFVMVASLVVLLLAALMQLALTLHVRNILTDAAAEGARYGAILTRSPAEARARTLNLIKGALGTYPAHVEAWSENVNGAPHIRVSVSAPVPFGVFGGAEAIKVSGRAISEEGL